MAGGISKAEEMLESSGRNLYSLGSRITIGLSAPLAGAVGMLGKLAMDFDQAMTESLAIMDGVNSEMRLKMEDQAKIISTTTKFTAAEAAKAYYDLASSGLTAEQSLEALPVAATFAQASMMDLSKATESLSAIQAAMGLKSADAAENMRGMARVSDVLVEVNNRALGKTEDFTAALVRSGGSLKLYNKSIEEGAAVLGAYADKGVKGSTAGQQLYMVLRDLSSAAVKFPERFEKAGIAVFDAAGKMRNMADISDDMTKKLGPMSDAGKRAEIQFLGLTSRSQNALLPLLGMGDRIRELQTALEGAGGSAEKVAEKQMQSLQNQVHVATEKFKNMGIALADQFMPIIIDTLIPLIEKLANYLSGWIKWLDGVDDGWKRVIVAVGGALIVLGPLVMMLGSIFSAASVLLTPLRMLTGLLGSMGAMGVTPGAGLISLLSNPYVLGGAAVILGLALAWKKWKDTFYDSSQGKTGQLLEGAQDASGHMLYTLKQANEELGKIQGKMSSGMPAGMSITIGGHPFGAGADVGAGGPTPQPDVKPTKTPAREQNLLDRISGKQTLADAEDWARAIENLGGVWNIAEGDLKSAYKVFEDATDRLEKNGLGASKTAGYYRELRQQILYTDDAYNEMFKTLGKIEAGGALKDLTSSNLPGYVSGAGIIDEKVFERMSSLEAGGGSKAIGPGMFGGTFIAAADLRKQSDEMIKSSSFWGKQMDVITHNFGQMASEMGKLGRSMGGAFGEFLMNVAEFSQEMQLAGQGGKGMKTGASLFGKGGATNMLSGGMQMAQGALEGYAAFQGATNSGNMGMNVLGGAATGAQMGMQMAGPWGAAVGAAVGIVAAVIKGKPEWARAADDIGRDMGVHISDALGQAIADTEKKEGVGRVEATLMHLNEIIKEAGGLNEKNLATFTGKLRDAFSGVETGALSAAQATKILDDNFEDFVKASTDGYGFIGDSLKEIITLNDKFGTDSKKIGEFLKASGVAALEGFMTVADVMLEPFATLHDQLEKDHAAIDKLEEDGKKGSEEWSKAVKTFNDDITKQAALTGDAKQTLDDLGIQAVSTFAAAVAAGTPWGEALKNAAPMLAGLRQAYSDMGINIDDVALKQLLFEADFLDKNPKLISGVQGLGAQIVNLTNMNLLNADSLAAMERTGFAMFKKIEAASIEMGGTSEDALSLMQDFLHKAEKAAKDLGVPLDDNTLALIDQSKELGIWSDKGGTATDKLIAGMSTLVDKVSTLIDKLSGVTQGINDIPKEVNVGVHYREDHEDVTPGGGGREREMAVGGIAYGRTHALIGEGPEPEVVAPLSRLRDILRLNTGSNVVYAVLNVDGREIARTVVEYTPQVLRESGLL